MVIQVGVNLPYGIEPIKPMSGVWEFLGYNEQFESYRFVSPYGIRVMSAVHMVEGKRQYHISITDNGERIPASLVEPVLKHFGAENWEEDNHSPFGKVRNFWKKIDEVDKECPCKQTEKPHIEGDYVWRDA